MNSPYKNPKGMREKPTPRETTMDHKLRIEISEYVEELTTSGQPDLNKDTMKKLKNICKQSDAYVTYTYDLVMTQLRKEHSEIRISAFQITDELFNRSHAFRELLLADFQDFMDLTIEANPEYPLPPPKPAAKKLKTTALDGIHKWNEKYGNDYKKISLGYNYLKNCKKMDFTGTQVRTQAEQRRTEEQQQRQEMMRKQRLENVLKEMSENSLDIKDVLIQIENSLRLLLPDPESFQIHGLMSPEHQPSYTNPFLSYAKRTPAEAAASRRTVRKTSDPSKIKGRRASQKNGDPETSKSQTASAPVEIKEEPLDHSSDQTTPDRTETKKRRSSNTDTNISTRNKVRRTSNLSGSEEQGAEPKDPSPRKNTSTNTSSSEIMNEPPKQSSDSNPPKRSSDSNPPKQSNGNNPHKQSTDSNPHKQSTDNIPNKQSHDSNPTDHSNDSNPTNYSKNSKPTDTVLAKKDPDLPPDPNETEADNDDFEEISTPSGSDSDEEINDTVSEADVVRDHGLMSQLYRMQVEISPEDLAVRETDDNTDILLALREFARQVARKFIPQVQRWLEVLSKTGAAQSQIQKAIDMKNALELAKKRTTSFKIVPMVKKQERKERKESADTDDEDDFEDVPTKEGYEDDIPDHLKEPTVPKVPRQITPRDWTFPQVNVKPKLSESEELDPTTPQATLRKLMKDHQIEKMPIIAQAKVKSEKAGPSSGQIDTKAPVVPFGIDLLHWGEKVEAPMLVRYESSSHRFWNTAPESDDAIDRAALHAMQSRTINFTGNFEPVKWSCRAPLNNGTLCPRKDRFKCPFHGKVIARDNIGRPSNVEDAQRLAEEEIKKRIDEPAEWEDPALQAEIEAATGVSLNPSGAKGKGQRKGRQRKYPGLTNLKKLDTKTKLEKKILNPSTLRRVEGKISSMNIKRHNDKFGNNYNYARNNIV